MAAVVVRQDSSQFLSDPLGANDCQLLGMLLNGGQRIGVDFGPDVGRRAVLGGLLAGASIPFLGRLDGQIDKVSVAERLADEDFVGSSIQFRILSLTPDQLRDVIDGCRARGVDIKWFGRGDPEGFTSTWRDWRYVADVQDLPQTRRTLDRLCDMRIPIDLSHDEATTIAQIIGEEISSRAGR